VSLRRLVEQQSDELPRRVPRQERARRPEQQHRVPCLPALFSRPGRPDAGIPAPKGTGSAAMKVQPSAPAPPAKSRRPNLRRRPGGAGRRCAERPARLFSVRRVEAHFGRKDAGAHASENPPAHRRGDATLSAEPPFDANRQSLKDSCPSRRQRLYKRPTSQVGEVQHGELQWNWPGIASFVI
jgi:hypothetical protein